jgi:chromosome segregation ATPase
MTSNVDDALLARIEILEQNMLNRDTAINNLQSQNLEHKTSIENLEQNMLKKDEIINNLSEKLDKFHHSMSIMKSNKPRGFI